MVCAPCLLAPLALFGGTASVAVSKSMLAFWVLVSILSFVVLYLWYVSKKTCSTCIR